MDFPRPEVFGNYILKDLGDIVMPADLDWWPIQTRRESCTSAAGG